MSDEWQIYPGELNGVPVVVLYDHGIRDSIDDSAPPNLLQISVLLREPNPGGMPSDAEADRLTQLENDLQHLADQHSSWYVGRVTSAGLRTFFVYTPQHESHWTNLIEPLVSRFGYKPTIEHNADETHSVYWQTLYPNEESQQVIQDLALLQTLHENEDNHSKPRRVDHWAYFPSQEAAVTFVTWLVGQGYNLERNATEDEPGVKVQFYHETSVTLPQITACTLSLHRKAVALGGDYDGWETVVCI